MLEHAVLEHSILAVSRLYKNISFAELGSLLHTPPARVCHVRALGRACVPLRSAPLRGELECEEIFERSNDLRRVFGRKLRSVLAS
jgi:hypothetical protein